jgi:hypothetical protein
VIRRTHAALEDFALVLRTIFGAAYGGRARFNAAEGIWKLPNGAYVELGQLAEDSHYARYQGRSFSLEMAALREAREVTRRTVAAWQASMGMKPARDERLEALKARATKRSAFKV